MNMKRLLLVTGLIAGIIVSLSAQNKNISLEDIWAKGTFRSKGIYEIRSMNDGLHYCVLEADTAIGMYEYKSGNRIKSFFSKSSLNNDDRKKLTGIEDYQFSNDEKNILFTVNSESIYRHSSISDFYIWNSKKSDLRILNQSKKQRLAEFSPDGQMVAFVQDNNLYIKNLITNDLKQITNDGLYNSIIYGTTDWVYEEEFGITKGFYWSKDGKYLTYYRFDESKVKEFSMTTWGDLYPQEYKYKYPKAGEDNSVATVFTYNTLTNKSLQMQTGDNPDQYIPRLKWSEIQGKLAILRMNRLQNKLEILLADAETGKSQTIFQEENKYYISISEDLTFLQDKKHFLLTSERDGYNHIYLFDLNGKIVKQLTKGKWDVDEIKGVDEKNKRIFYRSSERGPENRDLAYVDFKGKMTRISTQSGTHDADFSKSFLYYISTYSDANTPMQYAIYQWNGKLIKTLEDNKKLQEKAKEYGFVTKEFSKFTSTEGVELHYWIMKPANFDSTKKYPVLMYVYGGPGAQTVNNSWERADFSWYQMLTQKGYIVVSVENRGTGARGEAFKKATYMQLGKLETEDQISGAEFLGNLPYVDKDRIGIFGWSYGGYMSALCMTKGNAFFKAGIAVAPVTNWRYYDNIYTERYMRKPQDNASGYDDNSPINHVTKLKGKFLLVHGSGDDNVHVQNSMDLITALVNANKQFDLMIYPNKNHGIYGGNTRLHLYKKMTDFILQNL
jgi:dipeptidyl-peptidase 4